MQAEVSANAEKAAPSPALQLCNSKEIATALNVRLPG